MTWNIEGLRKYDNDYSEIKKYCLNFDIIAFSESFVRHVNEFCDFLHGYEVFNCVRPKVKHFGRHSGGISVFVRESLIQGNFVHRVYEQFENCVVLLFRTSRLDWDRDTLLLFPYVSPENSPIYKDTDTDGITILEDYLYTVLTDYPEEHIFFGGDFNARMKDFLDYIPDDNI